MRALILVDIQNDFCPGGTLAVREGDAVVPLANRLMSQVDVVVATQDWHPAEHGSFAVNHPASSGGSHGRGSRHIPAAKNDGYGERCDGTRSQRNHCPPPSGSPMPSQCTLADNGCAGSPDSWMFIGLLPSDIGCSF